MLDVDVAQMLADAGGIATLETPIGVDACAAAQRERVFRVAASGQGKHYERQKQRKVPARRCLKPLVSRSRLHGCVPDQRSSLKTAAEYFFSVIAGPIILSLPPRK